MQEKALKLVPRLSEILDYGTVQNILLVKIAVRPFGVELALALASNAWITIGPAERARSCSPKRGSCP